MPPPCKRPEGRLSRASFALSLRNRGGGASWTPSSAAPRASRGTSRWWVKTGWMRRAEQWGARARACVPGDPRCSSVPRGSSNLGADRPNGAVAGAAAAGLKRGPVRGRDPGGRRRTTGRCICRTGTGTLPGAAGWACRNRADEYQRTSSSGPLYHSSSFSSARASAAGRTLARRPPSLGAIVVNRRHERGASGALLGNEAICDFLERPSARVS